MEVEGYTLPLVDYPGLQVPVHPHQAEMLDRWDVNDSLLVVTKTGSGKTAAVALPVARNRDKHGDNCAVFVYPTKELIRDQERSIQSLLQERLGLRVRVVTPENAGELVGEEDIALVRVDADILEDFCEVWGFKRKGRPQKARALERLLSAHKARIVLTNPDILYLLYSLRYGQDTGNVLGAFQAYQTIVFDEFHLYSGVELAHALYLIYAARKLGAFRRVVLLSATPNQEVRIWIERLLQPHEVAMDVLSVYPARGERQVAHDVAITPLSRGGDVVDAALQKVLELAPLIRQKRAARLNATDYVPAVVILNSVVKAIDLEDRLRAAGFQQDEIVPIRGMSARSARRLQPNQLVVVGTSAIEVGIDFQCDYLIFEAGDAAAFMQRFGRLGRHQPGEAFLLGSHRECQVIASLPEAISRARLEGTVAQTYPQADARAWFVGTDLGAFAALTQAFNIRESLWRDRDKAPGAEQTKEAVLEELKAMMEGYGSRMGIEKQVKQAQRLYWSWARGLGQRWVGDYLLIDSFRTSLPRVPVRDLAEEARRGPNTGKYDLDVKALLERAKITRIVRERVEIEGYEQKHRVNVNKGFRDEKENVGSLLTTADFPTLMLARDGELTYGSALMSRLPYKHAFAFVPYDEVRDELDWKLAWFFCGLGKARYVLAFDGDALLLKEMYRRQLK